MTQMGRLRNSINRAIHEEDTSKYSRILNVRDPNGTMGEAICEHNVNIEFQIINEIPFPTFQV